MKSFSIALVTIVALLSTAVSAAVPSTFVPVTSVCPAKKDLDPAFLARLEKANKKSLCGMTIFNECKDGNKGVIIKSQNNDARNALMASEKA